MSATSSSTASPAHTHDREASRYSPEAIETHWQRVWDEQDAFVAGDGAEPLYVLEMFPYPSGSLHMGHVRNYTIGDVIARFQRMQGRDVLHPMGWDALGLPAENQAIKEKVAPQVRTPKNIAEMKVQMRRLGLAYDWAREIGTYLPEYYRWNQWFFVKLFEKGLVYRRESTVNWCPGCNTILANEQVNDDGECWRGHQGVTTRSIPEWAFKITEYAEELLQDLDQLTEWPDRIVSQQRNWIGKSIGARVEFPLLDAATDGKKTDTCIEVFTTRVDTIYGCTYVVLAPEHRLSLEICSPEQRQAVSEFIEVQRKIDKIERTAEGAPKEGVFTGAFAKNPYTGESVPVWLANFVLAEYGTGAVMSVPAHDQRDFEFAHAYKLPIVPVVHPPECPLELPLTEAFTSDGVLTQSGQFSDMSSADARKKMAAFADSENFGAEAVNWHLRDWGFSRQRYWGTPIPIVYCDEHGTVPVPLEELPVRLPDFEDVELTGEGGAPLARLPEFYETTCPTCGAAAKRETETMDTFVDSAWYFARFLSPHCSDAPFEPEQAKRWLPVDVYVGGPEHAVMHLLYFRFWTKVMRDLGLLDIDEPVKKLITQGMVHSESFSCAKHGYVSAADVRDKPAAEQVCPKCGDALKMAVEKMSKSKYNGVDPIALIERYGADTARLYTLFAAPPEKDLEWNPDGVEGISRFVGRAYRVAATQKLRTQGANLCTSMKGLNKTDTAVRQAVHRTLAKVSDEMGKRLHFNTAIAAMMELVNTLHEHKLHTEACTTSPGVVREALLALAQMLAPLAPHIAEQIWHDFEGEGLVVCSAWPGVDADALTQLSITMAVQVNGKLRGQVDIAADMQAKEALAAAKSDPKVAKHLEGKTIKKEIFVPKRLINFVVA